MASPEKPNFQDDIVPVFEQSCNSCHNPDRARGGPILLCNAILAGGSSGDALPENLRKPAIPSPARLQEPHMPPRVDKIENSQLMLIKNWIAQGMLPTASGKPMQKKKSSFDLALGSVSLGKPEGPPPMPKHLNLQPTLVTKRAFAPSAMASAPWSPLVALAGQKQIILYNTENLSISGILPYEEGFIESLNLVVWKATVSIRVKKWECGYWEVESSAGNQCRRRTRHYSDFGPLCRPIHCRIWN